jgi:hypothetical protein
MDLVLTFDDIHIFGLIFPPYDDAVNRDKCECEISSSLEICGELLPYIARNVENYYIALCNTIIVCKPS